LEKKEGQQEDYWLTMTDYLAKITGGKITPNQKDFSEAFYLDPIKILGNKERSRMGFCTQILLENIDRDPNFWRK